MVSDCDNRKQMWSCPHFVKILEKVKATLTIQGTKISIPKLTEEIMKCPSFKTVLSELCNMKENEKFDVNIKIDKKKLWD